MICTCIVVKIQEDPAIVICLKEGAIHEAMALPHAPCRQGATATESGEIYGVRGNLFRVAIQGFMLGHSPEP